MDPTGLYTDEKSKNSGDDYTYASWKPDKGPNYSYRKPKPAPRLADDKQNDKIAGLSEPNRDEEDEMRERVEQLRDEELLEEWVDDEMITVKFYMQGTYSFGGFLVGPIGDYYRTEAYTVTFNIPESGKAFTAKYKTQVMSANGFNVGLGVGVEHSEGAMRISANAGIAEIAKAFEGTAEGVSLGVSWFGTGSFGSSCGSVRGQSGSFGLFKGSPVSFTKEITETQIVDDSLETLPSGEPQYWADKREAQARAMREATNGITSGYSRIFGTPR